MRYALSKVPPQPFDRAEYTPASKPVLNGNWQVVGSDGLVHEILYWVTRGDPTGPPPQNPAADSQFSRWDAPVRAIYGGYGVQAQPTQNQTPQQPQVQQQQSQGQFGGSFIPQ